MTKEITKAKIIQEIQDKLKLREFAPANFLFDETVVPVYNIEQHLERWELHSKLHSITSATSFEYFVVPQNEIWKVRSYGYLFYNEGAYQISGMYISRNGEYLYLDLERNKAVSHVIDLLNPVTLNPGDALSVLVDTYVSTANLKVTLQVMKEEIR